MQFNPKSKHHKMMLLLEDIVELKSFIRDPYEASVDGRDLWIGKTVLSELSPEKDPIIKPFIPHHQVTRDAMLQVLIELAPQIRQRVLEKITIEYNNLLTDLEQLELSDVQQD